MNCFRLVLCAGVVAALFGCRAPSASTPGAGEVSDEDVHRFVAAWRDWSPADSGCAALRSYWDTPGAGLLTYRHQFHVDFDDLCVSVRRRPEQYAQLAPRVAEFDSVAAAVRNVYSRFNAVRPLEGDPSVYLVVGTGVSAGSTIRGPNPAILIGVERNNSSESLPWTIAHELVHTQQHYPRFGSWSGGPSFLRATLLRLTITEGAAEFLAGLVMDHPICNEYGEAHETELWEEFRRDASGKNYDRWIYNGWNRDALGERPPDIAYWLGYRIVRSYYERASDKARALDEILNVRDFPAFLQDSGYSGPDA